MIKSENIFLIGPMGSGKSTIGRQLALKAGKTFYDSDTEIERRTGAEISLIFEIEEEAGFRTRESKMIAELAIQRDIVLATGGGAVLAESNRVCLRKNGTVLYLRASLETILRRTDKDKKRPLLQSGDRESNISIILNKRIPIYESLSDYTFDTDNYSVKQMVKKISKTLELKCDE